MYKVLDKKTFKELPKKEQDIFIKSGAKDQQLLFQDEVGHQGLTWQDYIPETKQYLLEKYGIHIRHFPPLFFYHKGCIVVKWSGYNEYRANCILHQL